MKDITATKAYRVVKLSELPTGVYEGIWSGYVVRLNIGEFDYLLTLDTGVRGRVPCTVSIRTSGTIIIEPKRK